MPPFSGRSRPVKRSSAGTARSAEPRRGVSRAFWLRGRWGECAKRAEGRYDIMPMMGIYVGNQVEHVLDTRWERCWEKRGKDVEKMLAMIWKRCGQYCDCEKNVDDMLGVPKFEKIGRISAIWESQSEYQTIVCNLLITSYWMPSCHWEFAVWGTHAGPNVQLVENRRPVTTGLMVSHTFPAYFLPVSNNIFHIISHNLSASFRPVSRKHFPHLFNPCPTSF